MWNNPIHTSLGLVSITLALDLTLQPQGRGHCRFCSDPSLDQQERPHGQLPRKYIVVLRIVNLSPHSAPSFDERREIKNPSQWKQIPPNPCDDS